uniref:Uncharacterized protein n=1 Tax=Anguilla anguilla TaxID=7936 RepID=A0A0E9UCS2_ANGAN
MWFALSITWRLRVLAVVWLSFPAPNRYQ